MGFNNEFGKARSDIVSRLGCGAVQDLEFELFTLLKLSSSGISGDGVGSGEERSGPFMGTLVCKVVGVAEREEMSAIAGYGTWLKTLGDIVESGEAGDSVLSGELELRRTLWLYFCERVNARARYELLG